MPIPNQPSSSTVAAHCGHLMAVPATLMESRFPFYCEASVATLRIPGEYANITCIRCRNKYMYGGEVLYSQEELSKGEADRQERTV